jgi:hypothetical protein
MVIVKPFTKMIGRLQPPYNPKPPKGVGDTKNASLPSVLPKIKHSKLSYLEL